MRPKGYMLRGASGRFGLLLTLALILLPATAHAGQIVYDHGSEIWVMNEDGSAAKPLLNPGQVPGMTSIGDPRVSPNGGTSVAFEATTDANQAPVGSGPAGACGLQCTGIYALANGAVSRLTGQPAPCGPSPQWCGSFSTEPDWTADGRVAYEYSQYTWEYSCLNFPCSWEFTTALEEIHTVPPSAGAGPGPTWPVQDTGIGDDLAPIADPADAGKVAYIGRDECEPECFYPLDISTGSGTDTAAAYDDVLREAAWSPDGSTFADIEGGGERGIWTYAANASTTPGKKFVWALEDPIQTGHDPGNNPFDVTFSDPAWIGDGKILFAADDNLWTIPASCGSGGTPCDFPADATQLTKDGSPSSPDAEGDWTSASVPFSTPGGGTGGGGNGANGGKPSVSHGALTGLGGGRAKLSFEVGGGSLSKVVVKLPKGLAFAKSAKKIERGIRVRAGGRKVKFSASLSHGSLVLAPKPAQTEMQISIGPPAITVSRALAARARRHKVKKLTVLVVASGAGGATTLKLGLKPH